MPKTEETFPNMGILMDVPVRLTVQLGSCQMAMREVLQLNVNSVVELDKPADSPIELFVNEKLVARGEVVVVDGNFAIKITQLLGGVV